MPEWVLAVDIGGTFTDVVLLDAVGTTTVLEKVLTTPKDPAAGVMDGVRRALARAGARAADVHHVIHGTTLVTNALIERKGAPTALITTAGHEDALEIGRETRYDAYDPDTNDEVRLGGDGETRTLGIVFSRTFGDPILLSFLWEHQTVDVYRKSSKTTERLTNEPLTLQIQYVF